jgi:hypothetical protein
MAGRSSVFPLNGSGLGALKKRLYSLGMDSNHLLGVSAAVRWEPPMIRRRRGNRTRDQRTACLATAML